MTKAVSAKNDATRFRLLLALLLSICTIVGAMFVVEWWPLSKRRQLASEIEKAGGRIEYREDQYEQTKQVGVIRKLLQLSLNWEYFALVDRVYLKPRSVDDAKLILAFPNLRSLQLYGPNVTDEFLGKLNGLKELNELSLENVKLDDAKDALQQHPRLFSLRLAQCSLSTPLLNSIRGIKDLSSLTIEQCTEAQDGWQALHGAQSNLDLIVREQALSAADIVALHNQVQT
jgi:Leucine-rich repeat (LRR) protein